LWPNLHYQSNPRRLWSFLERTRVVTRPPDEELEREAEEGSREERKMMKGRGNLDPMVISKSRHLCCVGGFKRQQ